MGSQVSNPPVVIMSAKVITATRALNGASGDVAYTGVGFVPRAVFCIMGSHTGTNQNSVGFSDYGLTEALMYRSNANDVWNEQNALLVKSSINGTDMQTAILKSMDADGFTLTWTKGGTGAAATLNMAFLCLA